jgi:GTP-binding protein
VSGRPTVAIVGRQNVGKSTLVNRIFGRRVAIADDVPGVTRDRLEVDTTWRGRSFALADTAGFVRDATPLEAKAIDQAERAIDQASVIVLVVDVRTSITEEDARLADRLRRASSPVVLVANKADHEHDLADITAFYRLGMGDPIAVSALHGRGVGELLDVVVELLPDHRPASDADDERRVAIVGRPNVGKSSLFNGLLGDERSIVSEVSGTTRDSIDSVVRWPELGAMRFVDTAGMRRGQRVRGVEYYSFLRAAGAIDAADVGVVVVAADDGFTQEDRRIAARVIEAGKALLVVANKWDLIEDRDRVFKALQEELRPFARATAVRTSANTGRGVSTIPPLLADLHGRWSSRSSTSVVNEIIHRAQRERPTPRHTGTLHYATQVASGPPTFVVFGGTQPPDPRYRRFLENRLRRELSLDGVPIDLRFRGRRR